MATNRGRKISYQIWRNRGLTYQQIADKYGVSWQAVQCSLNYKYRFKSKGTYRRVTNNHTMTPENTQQGERELELCSTCNQMTNHIGSTCLKCGLSATLAIPLSPQPDDWNEDMERTNSLAGETDDNNKQV